MKINQHSTKRLLIQSGALFIGLGLFISPNMVMASTHVNHQSIDRLTSTPQTFRKTVDNPTVALDITNQSASPSTVLNLYQPNADQNDTVFWSRASQNFYLAAQMNSFHSPGNGKSLLSLQPGDMLHLLAYSHQMNVSSSSVIWEVNSPNASVTTSPSTIEKGNYQGTTATFIAKKPGIYTVQAYSAGMFSIPMVVVVGMSDLPSQSFTVTTTQTGILPLPSQLPKDGSITKSGVTFIPYTPYGNWIPIKGSTTQNVSMMNVLLYDANGQGWNYRLPVTDGQFSGLIESPFTGGVSVILFPNLFHVLTKVVQTNTSYVFPSSAYSIYVNGMTLNPLSKAVLASAFRDYNVSPQFAEVASKLLENSPSMETAIAAISNYASASVTYNLSELNFSHYIWQDAWNAWQAHSGVCDAYSDLSAAMMQSVGIPVQTIVGWANSSWSTPPATDSQPLDAHQWNQAWDGSQWIVYDPTWNANDMSPVPDYLTNEYFTDTKSLSATHLIDPTQVGTFFSVNRGR